MHKSVVVVSQLTSRKWNYTIDSKNKIAVSFMLSLSFSLSHTLLCFVLLSLHSLLVFHAQILANIRKNHWTSWSTCDCGMKRVFFNIHFFFILFYFVRNTNIGTQKKNLSHYRTLKVREWGTTERSQWDLYMCVDIYIYIIQFKKNKDKFSTDYAISKCEKMRVSHKKKVFLHTKFN